MGSLSRGVARKQQRRGREQRKRERGGEERRGRERDWYW